MQVNASPACLAWSQAWVSFKMTNANRIELKLYVRYVAESGNSGGKPELLFCAKIRHSTI